RRGTNSESQPGPDSAEILSAGSGTAGAVFERAYSDILTSNTVRRDSMNRHPRLLLNLCVLAALAIPMAAQVQERVDLDAVAKIRTEGLEHSHVMEITSYLTDVYGPRLTGSPNIKAAGKWVTKTMSDWGLSNVKLETWGPFGRGWSNEHFEA